MHNSVFWGYLSDDPIIRLPMDAFGAVGAGVVQLDAVAAVLAVHQQEEVDGSRYANCCSPSNVTVWKENPKPSRNLPRSAAKE